MESWRPKGAKKSNPQFLFYFLEVLEHRATSKIFFWHWVTPSQKISLLGLYTLDTITLLPYNEDCRRDGTVVVYNIDAEKNGHEVWRVL